MATFATHGDAPSFPIKGCKLQSDNFASAQTQPSQQQEHRVIPTADHRLPVTLRADPFDVIRRKGPRERGHRPGRDGRHSGSQIKDQVAPIARVWEEGAQRRRHEFRPLGMEAGRLALPKPDHVRRPERSKCHGSTSATVAEKTAHKLQRGGHRGRGARAFLSPVQAELVGELLRGCLRDRHRCCSGSSVA